MEVQDKQYVLKNIFIILRLKHENDENHFWKNSTIFTLCKQQVNLEKSFENENISEAPKYVKL